MNLKTDTEIICLPCLNFLNCLIMRQNARKMHHFEAKNKKKILTGPSPDPSPIWRGAPLLKSHPLCSNIVDDKTVTEMM